MRIASLDTVPAGGAHSAAGFLGLAAAPAFAAMALWTGLSAGPPDLFCAAAHGAPLGGMPAMYLLMCVFHLAPWLRLCAARCGRGAQQ